MKNCLGSYQPCILILASGKAGYRKYEQESSGDSKRLHAIKHPYFSFRESSPENFSLFPHCSLTFPLSALLPRVTTGGL